MIDFYRGWAKGFALCLMLALIGGMGCLAGAVVGGAIDFAMSLFSKPFADRHASDLMIVAAIIIAPWLIGTNAERVTDLAR